MNLREVSSDNVLITLTSESNNVPASKTIPPFLLVRIAQVIASKIAADRS